MPLFGKSKPKYTPHVGPTTMTVQQFVTTVRTRPMFTKYARAVGINPAVQAMRDIYAQSLLCVPLAGNWSTGTKNPSDNILRFGTSDDLETYFTTMSAYVDGDLQKMGGRQTYIDGLKGEAGLGDLYRKLQNASELEANYYTAPVPRAPVVGAPPIPPKPQHMIEHSKASSWLTHGVHGDTSAFRRELMRLEKRDGSFPLGADDTLIRQAWASLVPIAPAYRGWNIAAMMCPYPSNVGGSKVLNDLLADIANNVTLPPRGDNRWYDWALFLYGGMMTVQAFTDGNKRVSRLAYALMLLSGGVPFVAPNNTLGAALGSMG